MSASAFAVSLELGMYEPEPVAPCDMTVMLVALRKLPWQRQAALRRLMAYAIATPQEPEGLLCALGLIWALLAHPRPVLRILRAGAGDFPTAQLSRRRHGLHRDRCWSRSRGRYHFSAGSQQRLSRKAGLQGFHPCRGDEEFQPVLWPTGSLPPVTAVLRHDHQMPCCPLV